MTRRFVLLALLAALPAAAQRGGGRPGGWRPLPPSLLGAGEVRVNPVDQLPYALVPAGSFTMGCSPEKEPACDRGAPRGPTTIAHAFWMGETEVTFAAYRRFLLKSGLPPPERPRHAPRWWGAPDQAASEVSFERAAAYCAWAGGRLPTEAEWEWAARGGFDARDYPWGDDPPVCTPGAPNGAAIAAPDWSVALYDLPRSCAELHVDKGHLVQRFPPNAFGLFDMVGNVAEWTSDVFRKSTSHVLRSGLWPWTPGAIPASGPPPFRPSDVKVWARGRYAEGEGGLWDVGFRCVLDRAP